MVEAISRREVSIVLWAALMMMAGAPGQVPSVGSETSCSCMPRQTCRGTWIVQETANFRIWSRLSAEESRKLAEQCEASRAEIHRTWFGEHASVPWVPKCEVVVHSSIEEYNQALGCVNDRSLGCTTLKIDGERVVYRRVDLRADARDWRSSALPHELTHVVVADHLDRRRLPPWIDEGLAAHAEPPGKHTERLRALERAFATGTVYSLPSLLDLRQPPTPRYRDAFYGQSVSLVAFLTERKGPSEFVRFASLAMEQGEEVALQEIYGIGAIHHLQRQWLAWLADGRPVRIAFGSDSVSISAVPVLQRGGAGWLSAPTQE